jgi:hypothetical protein
MKEHVKGTEMMKSTTTTTTTKKCEGARTCESNGNDKFNKEM